jgi:integrase/recombinase XerC
VTAPLIAPVIPSSARLAVRGRRVAGAGRRLPLAAVPVPPVAPRDVLYGLGRIDAAGRVADRAVIRALGWRCGDRLTLTAQAGVVAARRDPAGMAAMTAKPYIVIPAALRRRCAAAAAWSPATGSCWPRCPQTTCSLLTRSPWWTRLSARTARSRTPREKSHDHRPGLSGRVPAGRRGRGAAGPYRNRVVEQWGTRHLDEPTPSEIRQLVAHVRANVVPRRNARGGRGAAENLIAALRCLYRHAEDDGLISERDNPARKVAKPRGLPSTRRAVADARLAEICQVAATTGDDPELDALILRLHTETACRRGGALALRLQDLDREQCLVLLREKGETVRWQPVSPTLMSCLARHGQERHAPSSGQLLRYRSGRPITYRRYDGLWERLGRVLPWVRTQQVSIHWIRHTTLTWVERNFGYAVARAYAGHADSGGDAGATSTYVRATVSEVAAALAALTGEPHPLASAEGW